MLKRLLVRPFLNIFWWLPWLRLVEEDLFMMAESACDRDVLFWYVLHDGEDGSSRALSLEEKDRLKEAGVKLIRVK